MLRNMESQAVLHVVGRHGRHRCIRVTDNRGREPRLQPALKLGERAGWDRMGWVGGPGLFLWRAVWPPFGGRAQTDPCARAMTFLRSLTHQPPPCLRFHQPPGAGSSSSVYGGCLHGIWTAGDVKTISLSAMDYQGALAGRARRAGRPPVPAKEPSNHAERGISANFLHFMLGIRSIAMDSAWRALLYVYI